MYKFDNADIVTKLKARSEIQPNGCWHLTGSKALLMIAPGGAYYFRSCRQWGVYLATGMDTYHTNKIIRTPVCGHPACVNPDHQNLRFTCSDEISKKKKSAKSKYAFAALPPPKWKNKLQINKDGSVKFW